MCQGLTLKKNKCTLKKNKCKNRKEPYCHLHMYQKIPQRERMTAEFTILNKFLPTELALKICSYLSLKVTIPLGIRKTPQKLTPSTPEFMTKLRTVMSVARLVREHLINQQVPIGVIAVSIKSIAYSKKKYGLCTNLIVRSIRVSPMYITVFLVSLQCI